ncbi:MAG: hypothetical protein ABF322_05995 [Lentimonas sp.]
MPYIINNFIRVVSCCVVGWLCAFVSFAADPVHGELLANPYFLDANYDHWEFSGEWRADGQQGRVVFEIDEKNTGFPAAVGRGKYFSLMGANGQPIVAKGSALSAKLTGITFNKPYVAIYNAESIGLNADYALYFEIDIMTATGVYRAKSQQFNKPWMLPKGELELNFEWDHGDGFLGNPFKGPNRGIQIQAIKEVFYKAVIQVNRATDPGSGTVFVTLDNLSLTFQARID